MTHPLHWHEILCIAGNPRMLPQNIQNRVIYAGTVVRAAPVRQGGEILRIDWLAQTITHRSPVTPTNPSTEIDVNTRGNSRGCRGIAVVGTQVVYANYHTIIVADKQLSTQYAYTHPLFVGLHELCVEHEHRVLIAATALDGAHVVNLATGQVEHSIWPRLHPTICRNLGVDQPTFDSAHDQRLAFLNHDHLKDRSHLHFNAVACAGGRRLGLFNRFGVICDLQSGDLLIRDDRLIGAHNIVMTSETACAVCDTVRVAIRFVDLKTGHITDTIDLREYAVVRQLEMLALDETTRINTLNTGSVTPVVARPLFVRGLVILGDRAFVGLSPATILEFDLLSRQLVGCMTLTHDPRVCIHGLAIA